MTPEQAKELRDAAKEFFNVTVANKPTTVIRSTTRAACNRTNRAADRLEKILLETQEAK